MNEDWIIQTKNLTKQYNGKGGIRNISLDVPRGTVFGFIGPNGAGKSTFVRTMLGLIHPDSGTAQMLGQPIGTIESKRRIGYLPELFRYPDWLTGWQLLETHAKLCDLPFRERKAKINEVIEKVGLKGREKEKIRGYSKGMQQRIGLACALLSDPELIFLDEPTSALDPIGRKEVRHLMEELREQGKTVFLNSHLLNEIEHVCDHVAIINKGELIVQGDWRSLMMIQTEVEVTLGEKSELFFEQLPSFIKNVRKIEEQQNRKRWIITLQQEDDIPRLLEAFVSLHIPVYQLNPVHPHLEDVFMYWVNKKEGTQHVDNRQVIV
ncbi:ABC transporter ATP-binding protein [Bacillus sp. JJ1127]|uniref:ABC transporter ATP-binding protein n=1 Tax=Bacillus sp. JJ1127 TaxID=3122952 RepID=UPI0030004970